MFCAGGLLGQVSVLCPFADGTALYNDLEKLPKSQQKEFSSGVAEAEAHPIQPANDTHLAGLFNQRCEDVDRIEDGGPGAKRPPPSTYQTGRKKHRSRCGECEACRRPDCGKCKYCLDRLGSYTLRRPCIQRLCAVIYADGPSSVRKSPKTENAWGADTKTESPQSSGVKVAKTIKHTEGGQGLVLDAAMGRTKPVNHEMLGCLIIPTAQEVNGKQVSWASCALCYRAACTRLINIDPSQGFARDRWNG